MKDKEERGRGIQKNGREKAGRREELRGTKEKILGLRKLISHCSPTEKEGRKSKAGIRTETKRNNLRD